MTGIVVAIWGLAFKPGTDDMREAPSIYLIKELIERGAKIKAYDPKSINEARHYLDSFEVSYFEDKYDAVVDADVCVLVTEWKEFRSPDFKKMKSLMKGELFVDGRNQYNSEEMEGHGFCVQTNRCSMKHKKFPSSLHCIIAERYVSETINSVLNQSYKIGKCFYYSR